MPSSRAEIRMTTGMQPQPKAGKRAKGREVIHTNKKRAECLSCVCVCVCEYVQYVYMSGKPAVCLLSCFKSLY